MKDHLRQLVQGLGPLQGRNMAREYLQARILAALQRTGAMTSLAFHGGTCLRFLFRLPRYSEDLDFALEGDRAGYRLRAWLQAIRDDLAAEQYQVDLRVRDQRAVHGAFIRFRGTLHDVGLSPHPAEVLAVKLEVDTRPPPGAATAVTVVRRHDTLRLFHHDRPSLLAGKLHALLQRSYTKGRDLYDLIWYLSDPGWPAPNLTLLNAALVQTGWRGGELTPRTWRPVLAARLEALDWERAAGDLRPFLERPEEIALVNRNDVLQLVERTARR